MNLKNSNFEMTIEQDHRSLFGNVFDQILLTIFIFYYIVLGIIVN